MSTPDIPRQHAAHTVAGALLGIAVLLSGRVAWEWAGWSLIAVGALAACAVGALLDLTGKDRTR